MLIETSHMFKKIRYKVRKSNMNFDSWSHEQYIIFHIKSHLLCRVDGSE